MIIIKKKFNIEPTFNAMTNIKRLENAPYEYVLRLVSFEQGKFWGEF